MTINFKFKFGRSSKTFSQKNEKTYNNYRGKIQIIHSSCVSKSYLKRSCKLMLGSIQTLLLQRGVNNRCQCE